MNKECFKDTNFLKLVSEVQKNERDSFDFNLAFLDVLVANPNVFVSVGADMFMVEAQSVKNLMFHSGVVQTPIFLQREFLSSVLTTKKGPTPEI